jgi:hypothetical protein
MNQALYAHMNNKRKMKKKIKKKKKTCEFPPPGDILHLQPTDRNSTST